MNIVSSIFVQFDKSLLGVMLISAFILGVFLTYFFKIKKLRQTMAKEIVFFTSE